jgi:hypothetical protein
LSTGRGGGPRSPEGKLASSKNALTHGITSNDPVAGGESREEWVEFRDDIVRDCNAIGPVEMELATDLAIQFWRLRRVTRAETGSIASRFEAACETDSSDDIGGAPSIPDQALQRDGCDLALALSVLDSLSDLEETVTVDSERVVSFVLLVMQCLPNEYELPIHTGLLNQDPITVELLARYFEECSDLMELPVDAFTSQVRELAERVLAERAARSRWVDLMRARRQRAAVLPNSQELDSHSRYEAHLRRGIAKNMHDLKFWQSKRREDLSASADVIELTSATSQLAQQAGRKRRSPAKRSS